MARPADQGSEMRPLSLMRGARPRSRFSLSASALSSSNLRTCKSAILCPQLSTYTDTFATRLPLSMNRLQLSRGGKEDPARRGRRRPLGPMGGYWQGAGRGGGLCWRLCFSRGKCCSSTAMGRAARGGDGRETPPTPARSAAATTHYDPRGRGADPSFLACSRTGEKSTDLWRVPERSSRRPPRLSPRRRRRRYVACMLAVLQNCMLTLR